MPLRDISRLSCGEIPNTDSDSMLRSIPGEYSHSLNYTFSHLYMAYRLGHWVFGYRLALTGDNAEAIK